MDPSSIADFFQQVIVAKDKLFLPEDIPKIPLGNLVETKKGRRPETLFSYPQEGTLPYINIKAFEQQKIEYYGDPSGCVEIISSDILMVWDGMRSGLVGSNQEGILGSTLKKLTIKEAYEDISPQYIKLFLQSHYKLINGLSRGSVIQHVDPGVIWNLEVPILWGNDPRAEFLQNVLTALGELDWHLQKQHELLRAFQESLLRGLFNGPE